MAHPELIARALPAGAAIILRDYGAPDRAHLAARLKAICAPRGVKLLIGAEIGLAERIGADGVHLPRWHMLAARPPAGMIVSAACHDAGELARAKRFGADIALLSPVFGSASHPQSDGLGAEKFKALAAAAALPVFALGGVDETNAMQLAGRNVAGIGAISAFYR